MSEHEQRETAPESTTDAVIEVPVEDPAEQNRPEEFGQSGIEYAVLVRRPGHDWELYDGEVFSDPDIAAMALAAAQADLAVKAKTMWDVLANTPDEQFEAVAADLERVRGAEATLFARAVSSFVRAA